MKKTKRIVSMAVAVLMAASMLPGAMLQNASAAAAVNKNADMYSAKTCVTSKNMEDFEGFELGTTWTANADGTTLTSNISSFIDVKIKGAGNKAEIVEDNGSKALKITYVGSGSVELFNYFTSNHSNSMGDQIVRAGAKTRFESFTEKANITEFNKMYNQAKGTQIGMLVCGKGKEVWINQFDPKTGKQVEDDLTKYRDKYYSIASTYNRTTKLGTVESPNGTVTWQGANNYAFQAAEFTVTTASGNYKGFDSATDASGNAVNTVIYLDDIFSERITYKVNDVTVGGVFDQGKTITNVPLNAPINVKLTDSVSEACVNSNYVTLVDSDGNAVDFAIEKDSDRGFTVYPKGQNVSKTYTLTVKSGIKSAFNESISTTAAKTVTYTTCADGLAFKGYIENMSFDDLEDQSYSKEGQNDTFLDGKIQIYYNTEGDSISVTTDPVTGSKALKLTRAQKNLKGGLTKYNYAFNPVVESGKVTVDFDVRMVCDNGSATNFISFGDSNTTGAAGSWTNRLNGNYWWRKSSGSEQWTNKGTWDRNVYFPAMMSVDLETDTFRGQVYRKYGTSNQQLIDANWTFEQSAEKNTSNIGYMNIIDFRSNVVGSTTEEINVYIDNLKIAHYDYQKLAVESVSKKENKADISGEIVLEMNAEVADADVTTANFMLMDTDGNPVEGYTVTKDANKIIIKTPTDLAYETGYFVTVRSGVTSSIDAVLPMDSFYTYAFTTKAWSPYIYEDEFEGFEIGQKWEGPQTVKLGNASVTLEAGDSIEYALDEATDKVGFKLVKGTATGNLDFKYIFPEGFKDGKYRVYVDERIENWSKAFYCWPALLDGDGVITSARGNRMTGSYWFVQTGNYKGTDRFGFDWSEVNDSRWISGYDANKNYKVVGELTTGTAYNIGLLDIETNEMTWSKVEPASDIDTLGGVSMRINGSETDYSKGYYKGTQNSDNGVAWIYSIAVEKVALEVKGSSVESALDSFDPVGKVTVSFNDRVLADKVNTNTVKLYKGDALVEDVEFAVSEDMRTITITPVEGLMYNTEYKIVVDGVEGYDAVVGTAKAKTFAFKTLKKTGIEIDDLEIVEGGIATTLYNYNEASQSFATVGVVKDATGKILEIKFGNSGTVGVDSTADLAVEFDNVGATYELFVWDGINTMKPLVKKKINSYAAFKDTMVFVAGSNKILLNGEVVEETAETYMGSDGIYIPSELANKYLVKTTSDLSEADLRNLGLNVYVSDEYDFIAVGESLNVSDDNAKDLIMQFGVYASPDGNDSNIGSINAPVKTVATAKTVAEENNVSEIILHGGDYRLAETVNITSADNGMTIKAYGDGEVKIKGSVELPSSEFVSVTDSNVLSKIPESARTNVKQINLSDYISEDMTKYPEYAPQVASAAYYELFSGDKAQTIARWPNEGFSETELVIGKAFKVPSAKATLWKNADNGMIVGYFKHEWAMENIYIDKKNSNLGFITLSKEPQYGLESGQRYYAMNMLEELDVAGEYYIDYASKILYYYPTSEFGTVNPELSILKGEMFRLENAYNITFEGVTLEKTRGNGIYATSGKYVTIDNCIVKNIGNGGIIINAKESKVVNSDIYAIGGTAVRISAGSNEKLTAGNVIVENNKIHDFGRIFRTYQGAVNVNGSGNTVRFNEIYNAPHCALRFTGSNHVIANNEFYNVVYESSDAGAIYAGRTWTTWGNVIKDNYFHDIVRAEGLDSHSVAAVYCDDQLTGTTVEGNLFKNCYRPVLFGGGTGNIFKNNTIVDCETGIQYDNRGRTNQTDTVIPDSNDSNDTLYEAFVKFISNSSVVATLEERKTKHNGFTTLLNDVESYMEDSTYEMGYPKSAVITGNVFYGANVNNSDYETIEADVKTYGTVSGNTYSVNAGEYSIPVCGIQNK